MKDVKDININTSFGVIISWRQHQTFKHFVIQCSVYIHYVRKTYELEFNKLIRQRKKSLEIFDIQLHETYLYTRNKNKNVVEFLRRNSRGNEKLDWWK